MIAKKFVTLVAGFGMLAGAALAEDVTYTIQPNDSLAKIAMQFYGDSDRWQDILAANPETLKGSGSIIIPGMVLTIPDVPAEDAGEDDATEASVSSGDPATDPGSDMAEAAMDSAAENGTAEESAADAMAETTGDAMAESTGDAATGGDAAAEARMALSEQLAQRIARKRAEISDLSSQFEETEARYNAARTAFEELEARFAEGMEALEESNRALDELEARMAETLGEVPQLADGAVAE